jgi:hypothetical protein
MAIRMRTLTILAIFFAALIGSSAVSAQPGRLSDPLRDEVSPKVRDTLTKMRIEDEKKDFAEMLKRGEDAVKLASDLDEQVATNGRLTENEMSKVADVEKLVKKIRSDLGGRDDDEGEDDGEAKPPSDAKDAVRALKRAAVSLYAELKNASRFTVSGTAIQTTNAILKVARFLRISN